MRPLEAYENVMRFAAERGEPALRLALHAAVPQSFRPGFLHLLRLNFIREASHETEADVLLAPFCEDIGGGYYQFDPEARRLLLDQLDPAYPGGKVSRVQRVADFLATYIESERGRLSAEQDRLAEDYLAIQGWVALAFLQPETAAMQLAAALDQGTQGEVAARVQFSGLASALSVPLVKYPTLLTYAAGIEAMEQGRADDAASLLERLPDEEIRIGGVTLRSPRKLLAKPDGEREQRTENAATPNRYGSCFISYRDKDQDFVDWLGPVLQARGVRVWTADHFSPEQPVQSRTVEGMQSTDTFLLVLSKNFRLSSSMLFEVDLAQSAGRPIITLMIDPPQEVLGSDVPVTTAIDFSQRENYERSLATLLELLEATAGAAPPVPPAVEEPAQPEPPIEQEPREVKPGFIFLSSSREDAAFAQDLRIELKRAGLRVWGELVMSEMMEDTEGERSKEAIELSTVFVALLSRHTLDPSRRFFRGEHAYAARIFSERGPSSLVILPVVLDDTNLSEAGLPDLFYEINWFYLRNDEDRRRLVEVLREIVRERGVPPSNQPFA
ncbi:MAG TPA: toll/interleukin-1 receptor domain-containing protein [Thermoanaerobaculia bacterium]|nr:toll/interleukin-1 receptor domain-containing protein [Thermoanaerobaculia bacterium]